MSTEDIEVVCITILSFYVIIDIFHSFDRNAYIIKTTAGNKLSVEQQILS